jgi:hypothetical protein
MPHRGGGEKFDLADAELTRRWSAKRVAGQNFEEKYARRFDCHVFFADACFMLANNVDDIVDNIRSGVKAATLRAEIFSELSAYELTAADERNANAFAAKITFPVVV